MVTLECWDSEVRARSQAAILENPIGQSLAISEVLIFDITYHVFHYCVRCYLYSCKHFASSVWARSQVKTSLHIRAKSGSEQQGFFE